MSFPSHQHLGDTFPLLVFDLCQKMIRQASSPLTDNMLWILLLVFWCPSQSFQWLWEFACSLCGGPADQGVFSMSAALTQVLPLSHIRVMCFRYSCVGFAGFSWDQLRSRWGGMFSCSPLPPHRTYGWMLGPALNDFWSVHRPTCRSINTRDLEHGCVKGLGGAGVLSLPPPCSYQVVLGSGCS